MSVQGFVGYWGSGKTLEMVKIGIQALKDDPTVLIFNNFGMELPNCHHCDTMDEFLGAACTFFPLDDPTEQQKLSQPFGRRKLLLVDEIGGLLRARGSATWPPAGDTVFQQGRKLGIELYWTTQHWRFLDVNVRRVTTKVTQCSGMFFKRMSPRGVKPKVLRPRLIRRRVFDAPNPEATELPKKTAGVSWCRFSWAAANSYDTMRLVLSAQEVLRQQQEFAKNLPFIAEILAQLYQPEGEVLIEDGSPVAT